MRELSIAAIALLAITSSVSSQQFPTECPGDSTLEAVYLRHEYDCSKFYKCSMGKKQLKYCPTPEDSSYTLYFNPELEVCDWPWNVDCKNSQLNCSMETSRDLLQANPYNCSMYYACENGEKKPKFCIEGQLFDHDRLKCVLESETKCVTYIDKCPPEGLYDTVLLPHDCIPSKYYECKNEKMVEKNCPGNKNFNVNLRQCVTEVKCPPRGVSFIPHEIDCNLYYKCVDGEKTMQKCEAGLSFDPDVGMCTWPPREECSFNSNFERSTEFSSNVACSEENSILPHECSHVEYYECVDDELVSRRCPEGFQFNQISKECEFLEKFDYRNGQCLFVGQILPHPSNCSLFYKCTKGGEKTLGACLQGHLFNPVIEACDLPQNTNCWDENMNEDCPISNCAGVIRYPDQSDCSRYYQCEGKNKVPKKCPSDLYFDSREQICNYLWNVDCKNATMCVDGELKPHQCRCDKYYKCKNGMMTLQQCEEGKRFDSIRKVCDEPDKAVCNGDDNTSDPHCIGKCSSINTSEYLPNEDCQKYCRCVSGIAHTVQCPKNQVYNTKKQKCDWPEEVEDLKCEPFLCDHETFGSPIPNPCFCDRYYACTNGEKYLQFCEKGLHFDYEIRKCVNPSQAHSYCNKTAPSV